MSNREHHKVHRLGHQGDGISSDGTIIPKTLPGEDVTGERVGNHLQNIRIETPSSDRVSPPCRHARSCGGCQLQHVSDGFLQTWKQSVVEQALAAHGLAPRFLAIVTSPLRSRRRAVFSARRTKKGALVGFHMAGSDQIVGVPDCQLLDQRLMSAFSLIEALAKIGVSRRGELSVHTTLSDAGLDISIEGGLDLDPMQTAELAGLARHEGVARLVWNSELIANRVSPAQQFGKAQVIPPPGAFLQATIEGEAALVTSVRDIVGGAGKVVDLFAGCGTFSLPLAETSEVHAVEGNDEMIAALDHGWRNATGLKRVTSEARDLFRRPLLPDELSRFGACVIDPPRAGAEAQVREIARSGVPTLAYVSCNPISFARDAKTLTDAGYRLDWVQVVDQFRWSTHVELVGRFTLTSA